MADRILFTGFRVRIGDENFDSPSQYRLRFYDSSTDDVKEVYDGPESSDISLGTIVDLDSEGYGPVSGIWLDPGYYKVVVQKALIDDPIDDELDWEDLWIIPKVFGGDDDTSTENDKTFQIVTTVANVRAISDPKGMAFNTGYYDMNDGGQGQWRWMSYSTQTDDGGAYLLPTGQSTAVAGRWHRVFDSSPEINVRLWGAIPGLGNVASNIEKADQYCASINDDSGKTLAFSSGKYNIGVTNLDLNRSGSFDDGTVTHVLYHFYENAVILGTGTFTITGKAIIDGASLVSEKLLLTSANVNGGYAKPEWWGAYGDESTDCAIPFQNCWDGIGEHTLLLNGNYSIKSTDVEINGSIPNLHFIGHNSWIKSIYHDSTFMNVGKISMEYSHQVFQSDLECFILHDFTYRMSEIGIESPLYLVDMIDGKGSDHVTLICDTTITFTLANYDFDDSVRFIFESDAIWNINDSYVTLASNKIIDNDQIFYVSSTTSVGNIKLQSGVYLPEWFGAIGTAKNKEFIFLINSVFYYGKILDYNNQEVTLTNSITLSILDNKYPEIRNMKLIYTNTSTNGIIIIGTASSSVTFDNCTISHYDITKTRVNLAIQNSTAYVNNCQFFDGILAFSSIGAFVSNNYIFGIKVHITSSGNSNMSQVIANNELVNSEIEIHSDSAAIKNITIKDNNLTYKASNSDNAFIYLNPDELLVDIENVRITGNRYNYPSGGSGDKMHSIVDSANTTTTGWSANTLDIIVEEDQLSSITVERLTKTSNVTNVLTHSTLGTFSVSYIVAASSTSFNIDYTVEEQLILNGRTGNIAVVNSSVSSLNTLDTGTYDVGKPGVVGSYAVIGTGVSESLVLAVNYPNGIPFQGEFSTVGGTATVTGQFIKIFGEIT